MSLIWELVKWKYHMNEVYIYNATIYIYIYIVILFH